MKFITPCFGVGEALYLGLACHLSTKAASNPLTNYDLRSKDFDSLKALFNYPPSASISPKTTHHTPISTATPARTPSTHLPQNTNSETRTNVRIHKHHPQRTIRGATNPSSSSAIRPSRPKSRFACVFVSCDAGRRGLFRAEGLV